MKTSNNDTKDSENKHQNKKISIRSVIKYIIIFIVSIIILNFLYHYFPKTLAICLALIIMQWIRDNILV